MHLNCLILTHIADVHNIATCRRVGEAGGDDCGRTEDELGESVTLRIRLFRCRVCAVRFLASGGADCGSR
jgi:hypothetical protein